MAFWNLLSLIPHGNISQKLLRTRGEIQLEGEAEDIVDAAQEIQTALHLRLDLKQHEQTISK